MLRNYLTIAFRNLTRNKGYSFINIAGLATGMTCCMLLLLYIQSELSYDKHHTDSQDIYLVSSYVKFSAASEQEIPRLPSGYANALQSEFPEVEQSTRLWNNFLESKVLLQVRESGKSVQSFYETRGFQIDSNFFNFFSYQFIEGNPGTLLADPHSIVLSEEVAHKLFGETSALNRIVRVNGAMGNGEDFKVTGVFQSQSSKSHIDARFFLPITAGWVGNYLRQDPHNLYTNNMFYTYLRLRKGTPAQLVNTKLPAFIEKYARKELKAAGFDKNLFLVSVPDLHLHGEVPTVVSPTNSITYLYIMGCIAAFTLLIACINFMNLSTARSAKRAAEVGIRKVMGAGRGMLVWQFMGESMILTLIALLTAIGLVVLFLPLFNQLTAKVFTIKELADPTLIGILLALTLFTGLLAGSYPAFYLSVFNPVQVLKGRFSNSISVTALRKGLVVFQFVVSIALIFGTLVIYQQMNFLHTQPLGFIKDQQLIIPLRSDGAHQAYTALRNEFKQNNQVRSVAGSMYYPGITNPSDISIYRPDQTISDMMTVKTNWVDATFMQQMGFQLLKGRMFSQAFPADTNLRIVVNEATLRQLGVPLEKAVGYKVSFDRQETTSSLEIVGIVKDFHFENLHQPIQPYAFLLKNKPDFNYLIVHTNAAQLDNVIPFLERKWKSIRPDEPFEYSFLNEDFQNNYQADVRTSRIVSYFTIISILISCLGLFGLAAFAAQQRTKEIGIRKVLGASIVNIVGLLSQDFLKLVLIALIIASPIAWYVMNQWLQGFAYKVTIEWWMFVAAGILAIGIALLTISFQSIKAALMNPVKSLRNE